jgi:hypothetical protein
VVEHPAETTPLASGTSVTADHYDPGGAFRVDLWYDQTDT